MLYGRFLLQFSNNCQHQLLNVMKYRFHFELGEPSDKLAQSSTGALSVLRQRRSSADLGTVHGIL